MTTTTSSNQQHLSKTIATHQKLVRPAGEVHTPDTRENRGVSLFSPNFYLPFNDPRLLLRCYRRAREQNTLITCQYCEREREQLRCRTYHNITHKQFPSLVPKVFVPREPPSGGLTRYGHITPSHNPPVSQTKAPHDTMITT